MGQPWEVLTVPAVPVGSMASVMFLAGNAGPSPRNSGSMTHRGSGMGPLLDV